jgi:hypothetical protein
MMPNKRLPPALRLALERLRDLKRPAMWSEFALLQAPKNPRRTVNVMRFLKRRGYVRDLTLPYQPDEPFTGPRYSRYVLTPEGERALALP